MRRIPLEKNPRAFTAFCDAPAKVLRLAAFVKSGLRAAVQNSKADLLRTSLLFCARHGAVLWRSADAPTVARQWRLAEQISRLTGCAFLPHAGPAFTDIVLLATVAVVCAEATAARGRHGGNAAATLFTLQLPRQRVVAAVISAVAGGIDGRAAAFVRGVARLSRWTGEAFLATNPALLVALLLGIEAFSTGAARWAGAGTVRPAAVR